MDPEIRTSITGPDASSADAEHLKLLAIFHFVYAGLIACGGCCVSVYFVMGLMMATGQMNGNDKPEDVIQIGTVMSSVAALVMVIIWIFAIAVAVAGRKILRRRSYMYCLVMAGLMCLNIPVGTALGVFTIYVLVRPSVKLLFVLQDEPGGSLPRRRTRTPDDPATGEQMHG